MPSLVLAVLQSLQRLQSLRTRRTHSEAPGSESALRLLLGGGAGEGPSGGKNWQSFTWLKMGGLDGVLGRGRLARGLDENLKNEGQNLDMEGGSAILAVGREEC